jgi:uncharacterized cupin superfamily protein
VDDDVYVSSINPDEWDPDPDVPGSEMHQLVDADGAWVGLTRFLSVDGPVQWVPPRRETIHVLEGEAVIEVAGGPTLRLGPGDLASLPAGRPTTWHITVPFKELWMFA